MKKSKQKKSSGADNATLNQMAPFVQNDEEENDNDEEEDEELDEKKEKNEDDEDEEEDDLIQSLISRCS